MARKANPIIMRLSSVTRSWDGKWFAGRQADYRKKLTADLIIRTYFAKQHRSTSISRIEIERGPQETTLVVHTSRPAMVIGRGGSGIEQIQRDLKKLLGGGNLRINVQEVRNPDTDSVAVATQVVEQLERRMPYRRILKQTVSRTMQAGAKGVRIAVAGRLNGSEIARREWLAQGNVPLQTFRADISFAEKTAFTTYGTIGVKVWINRGELEPEAVETPEVGSKEKGEGGGARRQTLAEKAKKSAKVRPKSVKKEAK